MVLRSPGLILSLLLGAAAASPPQVGNRLPAPPAAAVKKSALDKATLEAYVRHLFVWGPQITVKVADPKPSQVPGFVEVKVTGSAGAASQDETFLISKNGLKILRASVFDVRENPFKSELDKLKTDFTPGYGTPGAPVVLVLFSEYQCPFCREEARMLRENIVKTYPTQVRVYFKDYPLDQIHNWARSASIAGHCVARLNPAAFWDFHDWVFDKQSQFTPENLKPKVLEFAAQKQVDTLQLAQCMDTKATEAEIAKNIAEAKALGVSSLPTLFVNGRRLTGQIPWPNLRQIIDFELEYQKTAKNAGDQAACCSVTLPSPLPKQPQSTGP